MVDATRNSRATGVFKRLAAAGRGNLVMTLAVMVVSFVAQVGLGRLYGPAGLGEYNATTLFISVLTTLTFLGVPVAITQRVSEQEEWQEGHASATIRSALTVTVIVAVVAGILGAALWPGFVTLTNLQTPQSSLVVAVACAAMVLQYYVASVLLGRLDLRWLTILVVSQPLGVIAGALALGTSANGSMLATTGCMTTGTIAAVRVLSSPHRPAFDRAEIKSLFVRTVPGTSALYVTVLTGWLDRLIATLVLGPVGLGTYAAASYFIEAALRLPRAGGALAVAAYARLTSDPVGSQRLLDSHLRIQATYFIVAGAVLVGTASNLGFLFGPGFRSATSLQLLALALLPMGISSALAQSAVGSREILLKPSFLVLIIALQIAANLVGATALAVAGLSMAIVTVWMIAMVAYARQATRRSHSTAAYRTLAWIALAALPSYAVALLVGRAPVAPPFLVQFSISCGFAFLTCLAILVREPERRVLRLILRPDWEPSKSQAV